MMCLLLLSSLFREASASFLCRNLITHELASALALCVLCVLCEYMCVLCVFVCMYVCATDEYHRSLHRMCSLAICHM
jgi:hypothetical protein